VSSAEPIISTARDRHLFGPGPKRILALSGGGVRGVVSVAFLERLEKAIEEIEGRPVLLADWFDLIGGTSTGAIIASLLALGYRAANIREFYIKLAPRIFKRSAWRFSAMQSKFDAAPLLREIEETIGNGRTLDSEDLRTGLAIVTKRVDTGSPWIIVNNPRSAYWETPADKSFIGNRHYPLTNIVRASTAAPHYFEPEEISIAPGMPPGLFVDGGASPYNNPALALLMIAALPQHGLAWPLGPENMTIVSVGTGAFRYRVNKKRTLLRTIEFATHVLASQINDSEQLALTLLSWLGDVPVSWHINSELGDASAIASPFGRQLFRFLPYNINLDVKWLERELGYALPARTVAKLQQIDTVEHIPLLYELGVRGAARQIRPEHLSPRLPAMAEAAS
jgi:uncharacterized protein